MGGPRTLPYLGGQRGDFQKLFKGSEALGMMGDV
jgi:hypothetical protein